MTSPDPDLLAPGHLYPSALPPSIWGNNVRAVLTPTGWSDYKTHAHAGRPRTCLVCAGTSQLESHEDWVFDGARGRVTLRGLVLLCRRCHEIRHWGCSSLMGGEARLLEHLMSVNGWTQPQARASVRLAAQTAEIRAAQRWTVQMGTGQPSLLLRCSASGPLLSLPLDAPLLRLLHHAQTQSLRMPSGVCAAINSALLPCWEVTEVGGVPAGKVRESVIWGGDLVLGQPAQWQGDLLITPPGVRGWQSAPRAGTLGPLAVAFAALGDLPQDPQQAADAS